MKKYLTIQNNNFTEAKAETPESTCGFTYADYLTRNFKECMELIKGKIFKINPAPAITYQKVLSNQLLPDLVIEILSSKNTWRKQNTNLICMKKNCIRILGAVSKIQPY